MTAFEPDAAGAPPDGDRYSTWDASYVLGALSPSERREFEAHMQACATCRAAVADLSGMPPLLAMVDLADVQALDRDTAEPSLRPELREQLLGQVRFARRRRRWVMTAAVGLAAALLAVGVVLVIRPETLGLQPATQQTVASLEMAKVSQTPINASITMADYTWGTRIDMACSYGDWGSSDAPPQNLGMVVIGRDGSHDQIATWLGLSGATALPSGNTPMAKDEIAAVQLVSADDGKVLLEKQL